MKFQHVAKKQQYPAAKKQQQQCFSIYVRNISPTSTKDSVAAFFKRSGKITSIQLLKDRVGQRAFVHFERSEDAEAVVKLGRVKFDGVTIVVARNRSKRAKYFT